MNNKIILILIMALISSVSSIWSYAKTEKIQVGEPEIIPAVAVSRPKAYDETRIKVDTSAKRLNEGEVVFESRPITKEIKKKINGVSWNDNAPYPIEDLAYVRVSYIDFEGNTKVGELIVHKLVAKDVLAIFKELYKKRFPIEKIMLIDEYNADDNASMEDNNSSALCVRNTTDKDKELSKHAYGLAVDINPVQNPYVRGDSVYPPQGTKYLDRTNIRKGMIIENGDCYNTFLKRGWTWGGNWNDLKDYQHFEKDVDISMPSKVPVE